MSLREGLRDIRTRRSGQRRRPAGWVALAVALNVALGMAYSIIALRAEADGYREVEVLLSRVSEQSSVLDGLAWRAVAQKGSGPELAGTISDLSDQVAGAMRRLTRMGREIELPGLRSIEAVVGDHIEGVEEQIRLLEAGRIDQARTIGEQRSIPSLARIRQSTEAAKTKASGLALRSSRIADVETVVMMGIGALLVTLLLRRLVRAKRSADSTAVELRVREARMRHLVEYVPAIVYTAEQGPRGRWLYVSPQVESLLGFTPEEWVEDPELWFRQVHPDDRGRLLQEDEAQWAERTSGSASEYRMLTKRGRVVWVRDVGAVIMDHDGSPLYWSGVLSDITDRKELEEQLEHQAFHDTLTGLANRALFLDRVEHALARSNRAGETLAVLFLDLDDFKTVNDSLGHASGDEVLVAVAARLEQSLRPGDTIARLGGDEFAILLEDASVEEAIRVVKRIIDQLDEPIVQDSKSILVHASFGIAIADERRWDAADLLRNADVAMYAAKARGKGRFEVFRPDMHVAALKRLEIQAELQRAIQKRQFVLHYQPILELDTGRIVAVEALIRWNRSGQGLVAPADFIPAAEESDLIVQIGRWVLEEACHQVRALQLEYPSEPPLAVNVNVSGKQFQHPGLVDDVAEILKASGLDPERLTLEITESILVQDTEAAVARLRDLKALGVRVAVDDFGTGYSSLGYLQSFPIDILKIDKAFVDGIGGGAEGSALVRAIISLGESLSLGVSAEGIETEEQLAVLRALRCRWGQGFYFSKPKDADGIRMVLDSAPTTQQVATPLRRGPGIRESA